MFEDLSKTVFEFIKTNEKFTDLLFEQHSKNIGSKAFFIDPSTNETASYIDGSSIINFNFRIEVKEDFSNKDARFDALQELNKLILWLKAHFKDVKNGVQNFNVLQMPSKYEVQSNNNFAVWVCVLQLTFGD